MLRWLIPLVLFFVIELYAFQAIKTISKSKIFYGIYLGISLILLVYIAYFFFTHSRGDGQNHHSMFVFGLFLIVYIPKLLITLLLFSEDIFRIIAGIIHKISSSTSVGFLPERRKFVSQVALSIAAIPFASFIYGMTIGKYNFKVRKQTLFFPDLPSNFDGFTITQISDIHSGSFDDSEKIQYAIDLINEQNSDLLLFTGDIVNTHAHEMLPWIETFKGIKNHPFGKFSVLGNHDYGEYFDWKKDENAKANNFEAIKNLHQKIDFDLLLNQNKSISKGEDKIQLIGVENWGVHFKKAGDLAQASEGIAKEDFKILLSHDPSHWENEVKNHENHYHLTLSGHTHGMQFGIEIPGWLKWSPVQYVYKQWAGLYENKGRYIYVNRGFGFHAYAGRVGIMPEITVFELKKGEKNV